LVDSNFVLVKKIETKSIFSFLEGYLWVFNSSGRLECYDEDGIWNNEDKTKDILLKINPDIYSGKQYTENIRDAIKLLVETGKYLIVRGKILPRTLEQAHEFYSIFENSPWRNKSKDLREKAPLNIEIGTLLDFSMTDDGTTVWSLTDKKQRGSFIGVFSAFGDLLAFFNDDEINPFYIRKKLLSENNKPSFDRFISPIARIDLRGNIYYMVGYPEVIQFYKVKRTW